MKSIVSVVLGVATLVGVAIVGRWMFRELNYFLNGLYWLVSRYWLVLLLGGITVAAVASNLAKK